MKRFNKYPESQKTIRFQDCDPYGHLNNSKYLDYMLNAREDHLIREYGLNVFSMAREEGKGWVVLQNEIFYSRPVFVMETVTIQTRLINFTKKYVQAEMAMYDTHKTQLKAVLWTKFHHFDFKAGRGAAHSEDQLQLFEDVHVPLPTDRVEERAAQIIEELREKAPEKVFNS